jgi:predicted dehydrogenase
MKFVIAGLGSIGRRHLKNLLALDQRDIILYRSNKSTLTDIDSYDFPVATELEAALDTRPDAVIISNPTALHLEVAIPAAETGCHIFMEKPLSNSMQHIDRLKRALQTGKGKFFTAFQYRFHPGLKTAAALLQEGAIGRPLSVNAHWGEYLPGWHPWEDYRVGYSARSDLGGGVVLTLCHPIDYLRWMLGEISSVWAFTDKLGDLDLDVEDTAEIGLHFTNGVLGSVHLDFNQQPTCHTLKIIGTEGTILWDNYDGAVQLYRVKNKDWEKISPPADFERNHLFLAEMSHFLSLIQGESASVCTFEDGVRALEITLAALRSGREGVLVTT